jgi:ADP-ribose pyrophosphatase
MASMIEIKSRRVVFATDWFCLEEKQLSSGGEPYFALKCADYVSVVALNNDDELVLVRQYRPVVETYTLELPSGHVELGETPAAAAARELTEETGYVGDTFEEIAVVHADTGRLSNRMFFYFAKVQPPSAAWRPEPDLEPITIPRTEVVRSIKSSSPMLNHALCLAALGAAFIQGKI